MYNFVFNHQCNYPKVCFNQSPDSKQKFPPDWQLCMTNSSCLVTPSLDRNSSGELVKILHRFRIADRAAGVARLQRGAVWGHQELEGSTVCHQI